MIECSIVGGNQASRLATFMRDNAGGSIEISQDLVFASFAGDEERIKRQYISVSKMIYLLDETDDIMADLKVVYDLLNTKAFFKVREFWIFGTDNETNVKGMNVFQKMCLDLEFEDYQIRLSEDPYSLEEIYREITGLVEADNSKVPYKKIYRAQRDSEDNVGYDPKPYHKNLIPKEEDRLKKYEKMRESAIKAESNKVIIDKYSKEVPKVALDVNLINIDTPVAVSNFLIVSGLPRAGSSVLASSLAMCLAKKSHVNLLDISGNCGSARRASRKFNNYTLVDNQKLLLGENYSDNPLTIYTTAELDGNVKLSYLKYFLSIPNRNKCDYVVVDCDGDDLQSILTYCRSRVKKCFIVSQNVEDEITLTKPLINQCNEFNVETMMYLNNSIKWDNSYKICTSTMAKQICDGVTVISPVDFNNEVDLTSLVY